MRRLILPLLVLAMAMAIASPSEGYNITKILAGHPEFSSFNHYLSLTHLSTEINHRLTITVLAVDNADISSLLDNHLSLPTIFARSPGAQLPDRQEWFGLRALWKGGTLRSWKRDMEWSISSYKCTTKTRSFRRTQN